MLEHRKFNPGMVLPLLDVVPNEMIRHPGRLFSGQFYALHYRHMTNGKSLSALVADNDFHPIDFWLQLRTTAQTFCKASQIHQRDSRR